MQCFSQMVKICVEEVAVNTTISSCLVTKKLKITFDIMLCILRMAQKIGLAVIRTRHQIKLCHYGELHFKERCYVFILKKYFSVLPRGVLEDPKSLFYQHPKEEAPTVPWFKKQPRGCNPLQTMMKQICDKVGIQGKMNHSLRVTGASRMYECNVAEKLIKE